MILRKISEDATTITLRWDPITGAAGFRFTREKAAGRYSHTWDGTRTTARFSNDSDWYSVEEIVFPDTGQYPPPVTPPGFAWGFCSTDELDQYGSSVRELEFQDGVALGCTYPRLNSSPLQAQLGAKYYPGFVTYVCRPDGASRTSDIVSRCVDYARANPKADIELYNEPNLSSTNGGLSVKRIADDHVAVVAALKQQGLANKVMLCIGNSESHIEGLPPSEFCYALQDNGCRFGVGFHAVGYHFYTAGTADGYDRYMHIWTPDSKGRTTQAYFGDPPFYITEFGAPLDDGHGHTITEQQQADAVVGMMRRFKQIPNFRGGHYYASADEAGGTGTGYGWKKKPYATGQRKAVWVAFQAEVSA